MLQLIRNRDYYGAALFLLLLILVGYQQMISPAIGVFLLVLLAEGIFNKSLTFKFNRITALFVILYLFYLIGLFWSEHLDIGWKLLEYKMSYFIFPLVFLWYKKTTNVWLILQGLVWGCIFLAIRFLAELYVFNVEPIPSFEISRQILKLHPTYTSVYFTMASVFLVIGFSTKKLLWPIYVIIPVIGVFIYLILSMASFAAILFLAFITAIGFGFLIYRFFKWVGVIIYFMVCPFLIYFTISKMDVLKYDLEMVSAVYHDLSEGKEAFIEKNKAESSGTKERMILWYISSEIIAENPFGVGTGDIDFFLLDKCEKYQLDLLKELNLNPHNQFLQIGIDIGIPGILFLLFIIGVIMYLGIMERNYFLFFLGLSLFFNALFESVLQRQSGIVFYTCVICLVVVYKEQFRSKT